MPQFKYSAVDKFGKKTDGILDAKTADEIASYLNNSGYSPLAIKEVKFEALTEKFKNLFRIKQETFIFFNRQLATLIGVGLPLLSALDTLFNQTKDPQLKSVIDLVRRDVEGGSSFSESLSKYPKVFSELYVSMIRSAETAGTLPDVLNQIATLEEYRYEVTSKIKAAARYPLLIVIAMAIAIIIISIFVLPRFTHVFSTFGAQLPLPTRILIKFNYLTKHYWYGILIIIAGLIVSFRAFVNTKKGRLKWDRFKLKCPIFGSLTLMMSISRFCRILSAMIKSGVPILEALQVVSKTMANQVLVNVIKDVSVAVEKGEPMSKAMRLSEFMPPMVVDMVAIGEKSGEMDTLLLKVSDYYDSQVDFKIKNLTTMLEPLLLLFIGCMILLLALAIFLPMWNMVYIVR